jgi:hypothetical protein
VHHCYYYNHQTKHLCFRSNYCVHLDQYTLPGCNQQKTPNESRSIGFVRVIHPHHPLCGQIVKVLRQAGHAAYAERRWIVVLPDGAPGGIPWSWAVPIDDYTTEGGNALIDGAEELWAGVTELLILARMVQVLSVDQPEEVANDEGSGSGSGAGSGEGSECAAAVGAITRGEAARTGAHAERDAAELAGMADQPEAGGAA